MAYALEWKDDPPISPEEYLRRERDAETKSEYFDGRVYAMAGASPEHNKLATDAARALGNLLEPHGCEVYNADQRIRLDGQRGFFYPDLSVVCGDEQIDGDECLRNPVALIEVLSESTEHHDRAVKWLAYQRISSLRVYLLISQSAVRVEVFERMTAEGFWVYRRYENRTETIPLNSLGISLPLVEVYRRLSFDDGV